MKTFKLLPLAFLFLLVVSGVKAQSDKNVGCASLERPIVVSSNTCLNDSIQFDAGLFQGAHYSWDFNGDGVYEVEKIEDATPKYKFLNAGQYEPVVIIYTDGCVNGNKNETQEPLQVVNTVKPVIKVNSFVCDEISLERVEASILKPDSVKWNLYDTTFYTNNVEHKFNVENGKYEISLSTYYNGCVATATELIEIERLSAKPQIELTSKCAPATLTLKNFEDYNNVDFTWYLDGIAVSNSPEFVLPINDAANFNLDLSLKNEFGCFDSTSTSTLIEVAPEVVAYAIVEKASICLGEEISLIDQNKGQNRRTVIWGDGAKDTINRAVSHNYSEPGNYQITIVAENTKLGCVDTLVMQDEIVVFDKPIANFNFKLEGTCTPEVLEISNLAKGKYNTYSLVLNSFDSLNFDEAVVIREPGMHEIRFEVINEEAGCKDEIIKKFELHNPLSSSIMPLILEAALVDGDFNFSWKGVKNTNLYEVFNVANNEQNLLATVSDTVYTVPNYAADSNFSTYAVRALDNCGERSALSSFAQAIKLEGSYETDSFPTLQWNQFDAWDEELAIYEIERKVEDTWKVIGTSKQPHFVDRSFDNNEVLFAEYRVKALHSNLDFESISTEYTFEFDPNIFIPSAFSPNYDNLNDYYEIKGYGIHKLDIQIFNEWGQRVFGSQGENIAWDGKYQGEMAEAGTYICVVEMETPVGRTYNFQRTITLIR